MNQQKTAGTRLDFLAVGVAGVWEMRAQLRRVQRQLGRNLRHAVRVGRDNKRPAGLNSDVAVIAIVGDAPGAGGVI